MFFFFRRTQTPRPAHSPRCRSPGKSSPYAKRAYASKTSIFRTGTVWISVLNDFSPDKSTNHLIIPFGFPENELISNRLNSVFPYPLVCNLALKA